MSSLVWVIILLSFLLDKSSSQMLQGERVGHKRPAADMEGPTNPPPSLKRIQRDTPGSVYCSGNKIFERKFISLNLALACHEAKAKLFLKNLKGSKTQQDSSKALVKYHNSEEGYYIWETVLETSPQEYQNEILETTYKLLFYQEKLDPARCFPKSVIEFNRYTQLSCDLKGIRPRKALIDRLSPYALFLCKEDVFNAKQIESAVQDAHQRLQAKYASNEEILQNLPLPFKDQLFLVEKDLWVYPLLPGGLTYTYGMDKGDYRIVITRHGSLAGVVYERSMEERQSDQKLDSAIQFIPCERRLTRHNRRIKMALMV
ncbi:hypothetical protein GcM3_089012 [Golovinomyces cichoracearum]|uniref:Uncharacterized protein n=1 Tax=Golovinomyces cichoracearum TaxID=62708 RepID=A0A420IIQ4_9PEZI|nr:hypothetical protein GcM3_089012 [Golovinomyces cichoracearum]